MILELQIYIIKLVTNAVTDKLQEISSLIFNRISEEAISKHQINSGRSVLQGLRNSGITGIWGMPTKLCKEKAHMNSKATVRHYRALMWLRSEDFKTSLSSQEQGC